MLKIHVTLNMLISLLFPILVVRVVGSNANADMYLLSQVGATLFVSLFQQAIQVSYWHDLSSGRYEKFSSALGKVNYLINKKFVLIIVGAVFIQFILFIFSIIHDRKIFIILSAIFLGTIYLNLQIALYGVVARALNKVNFFESTQLISNLISVVLIFTTSGNVVYIALVVAFRTFITHWILKRYVFDNLKYSVASTDNLSKSVIYTSVNKFAPALDRAIVSQSSEGGLLALFSIVMGLMNAAATFVDRAFIWKESVKSSQHHEKTEYKLLFQHIHKVFIRYLILIFIVLMGMVIFKDMIVKLNMLILDIESEKAAELFYSMILLAPMAFCSSFGVLLTNIYFAKKEIKIFFYVSLLSFLFMIPIKVVLFNHFSLLGICAAISIYYVLNAVIFYCGARRLISY